MPFVLAVSGLKNSGKTTLCGRLLTLLGQKGLRGGYVKHSSHRVCSDSATDTGRLVGEGFPAVWWGEDGLRLEIGCAHLRPRENQACTGAPSALADGEALAEVTSRFFPGYDLVLLEGGKQLPLPRIWVGSSETIPEEVRGIIAFYGERCGEEKPRTCSGERIPRFIRGEEELLAAMVEDLVSQQRAPLELYVGSDRLPMKSFVAEFIRGALEGMLRSLKGGADFHRGIFLAVPPEDASESGEGGKDFGP